MDPVWSFLIVGTLFVPWVELPRTKETFPDFRKWCPVTRHPQVFRRLTDCQRTPGIRTSQDAEPIVDELKVEEECQVMAIENVLVKIDTFTFPMDFVTWGIEGDLQNSHILRRPLPSSSQAWIDNNKGKLTLLVGEEKTKFNLNQPLPFTEQERNMCIKIYSLLPSKGHMFEE